jgi:regulatory protein
VTGARPRPSCRDKAAELLARRPHFRAQLAAKLAARGYPPEEVDEALEAMTRHGYLDDTAAARGFVAGQLARGPAGRRRLAAELARRGAPSEAIETALAELPDDDLEAARDAAARWASGRRKADPAALARHLDRRGFTPRSIRAVLAERGRPQPED